MDDVLDRNLFLVKEHLGIFKAANNFDVYDPASGQLILECREEQLGFFTRLLRFSRYKRNTPFHVEIREPGGPTLIEVKRGISLILSKVSAYDGQQHHLGGFQQRFFSIGGKFDIENEDGRKLCSLKGNWTGWNFRFLDGERELASVTKKWSGVGKELFTSADNYMLRIAEEVPPGSELRKLILAAVMCIDLVLKE
jgi:uncharacterized protein YxjI